MLFSLKFNGPWVGPVFIKELQHKINFSIKIGAEEGAFDF